MASTVLRVKRKIDDNPQDALVLLCKRVKLDTEEISPSLFVFHGTVNNSDTKAVKDIVPINGSKLKSTHNVGDIIDKIRKERKRATIESRYEIVNCRRAVQSTDDEDELYNLVDLRKRNDAEKDEQYAYDLYVAAKQNEFDVSMLDNLVSIENYETNLILGSLRDNGLNASDDDADDDDDSNDENNWRNEYPDTEDSSINEEDMIRAMEKCDLDNDLSSDNDEDKFYDDVPDGVYQEDVNRYGAAYAKYKAKVLTANEVPGSLIHCRVKGHDEESVEGYKDDDGDGFYYGHDEDTEQFREQYAYSSSDDYKDEYSPD